MPNDIIKIKDDDILLRRFEYLNPNHIKDDGTITSLVFKLKKTEDGLSVNIKKLTNYENSIIDNKRFRLCSLIVKIPRDYGLDCVHNPIDDNYAHALITGNITTPISRKLASNAIRVRFPE
jgi:hypothetical protein